MGIFSDEAPKYWAAGLQAIPLYAARKRPVVTEWQKYGVGAGVGVEEQTAWVQQYPDGNVGLALGEASGIVAIDIDTLSPEIQTVLMQLLPPSPWERVGAKGCVLAYRWTKGTKTFRVLDANRKTLVECLSTGTQIVLPGSIHPDTGKPYTANCDLYDPAVLAMLMPLPPDFEAIIRTAFQVEKIKLSLKGHTKVIEWVSAGSRDTQMVRVAGLFSRQVLNGKLTFRQAIEDLYGWELSQVEHIAGDNLDIGKGLQQMAKFLIKDVMERGRVLPLGWDAGLSAEEKTDLGFDCFLVEHEPWPFERICDYLRAEFMIHEAKSNGRRVAINYALERMARGGLTPIEAPLECGRLLEYIKAAGGMGDTLSTLKNELKKLSTSGITGEDHTQIAKATLIDMGAEGEIRFVGGFWQWGGSSWEKLEEGTILKFIADKYGTLPAAKRSNDHVGILKIMSNQAGALALADVDVAGVNFANGYLLNRNEGGVGRLELVDHDPMFGCTYTLPFRYLGDGGDGDGDGMPAGAPMFCDFLENSWGGDEDFDDKVRGLREAIAVTMFSQATLLQRAFILHGAPKSGKSQMLKIIENLLPDEAQCAIKPEDWHDKFLPAEFFGKLINVCGELSEKAKISGTKFKDVVSGETISVQFKYAKPFKFNPRCAHWFASNHLPMTEDTSEGFNRRWLIFSYKRPVSDDKRVLDLGTIIAAKEREAIASWAVQVFPAVLKKRDYTVSASHEEKVEELAKQNNSVLSFMLDGRQFLVENTLDGSQQGIPEAVLYTAYFNFAIQAGVARVVSQNSFRQKMEELGLRMGFTLKRVKNEKGLTDCYYGNLIPARVGPAKYH